MVEAYKGQEKATTDNLAKIESIKQQIDAIKQKYPKSKNSIAACDRCLEIIGKLEESRGTRTSTTVSFGYDLNKISRGLGDLKNSLDGIAKASQGGLETAQKNNQTAREKFNAELDNFSGSVESYKFYSNQPNEFAAEQPKKTQIQPQAAAKKDEIANLAAGLHTSLYLLTRNYSAEAYAKKGADFNKAVNDKVKAKADQMVQGSMASANSAIDALAKNGALKQPDADALKKMVKEGKYADAMRKVEELLLAKASGGAGQKTDLSRVKMTQIPIGILQLEGYYVQDIEPKKLSEVNCKGNDFVISALEYASSREWLPKNANWKDEKTLKDLLKNPAGMELVKKLMLLEAVTPPDKLEDARGSIKANNAKDAAAEIDRLLSAPKEEPGKQDAYVSIEAYQKDPRVALMGELGGMKAVTDAGGKYSVTKTEEQYLVDAKNNTKTVEVQPAKEIIDAGKDLAMLVGINKDNALASMVALNVLWTGGSRKEVKENAKKGKQDVSLEVFSYNGKYYALNHDLGVADARVKKEGKAIAKAPLENGRVQELIRERAKADLVKLGAIEISKGAVMVKMSGKDADIVAGYLNDGELDGKVKAAIAGIVDEKAKPGTITVMATPTLGSLIAQEANEKGIGFEQTELYKAILAKCDDGTGHMDVEKFNALMASLNENGAYRAALKDGDNLVKEKVLAAIGSAPIVAPQQPASATGERMFNALRYEVAGFGPGPSGKATTFYRDRYDNFGMYQSVAPLPKEFSARLLYYMDGRGAMLPYYGEFGTPRQRRQPAPAEKQGVQQPAKQEPQGTAPAQQATKAQFSTGTWADSYLNASPPQKFLDLPREQQERVLIKLQQVVNKPENALVFDRKDAGDALLALDAAMQIIDDENKKIKG